MLKRTQTAINLLDVMTELELLQVDFRNNDGWIKVTDRKTLYRAAITALLECAESEGFQVLREDDYGDMEPISSIRVEDAPEIDSDYSDDELCMNLDGGCTCDACTQQINNALGM